MVIQALPVIAQAAQAMGSSAGGAVGAGVDLVGGLINMYHADKARGAGKDKLQEIMDVIRSVVPPDIEIDPEKLLKSPQLVLEEIKTRPLDFSRIDAPQFRQVQKYVPEIAPLIAEQRPDLAQQTARGKEGESAFMEALQEMRRVGRAGGEDPIARAATQRALDAANRASQGRQQAILQDMARRGTLGSGAELAASLQGASDAMGRAGEAARDAQADAYLRQLQAMRDAGRMGMQLSEQEMGRAERDTNIINAFNQRATAAAQRQADQRAQQMNQAQMMDIGERQRISDANERARYQAAVGDRDYLNRLAFQEADFARGEQDRLNRGRAQQFGMDKQVQDDLMRRQQQDYMNRRAQAGDISSVMGQQYDDIYRRAEGTRQNIQGISNAASAMTRRAIDSRYPQQSGQMTPQQQQMAQAPYLAEPPAEENVYYKYLGNLGGGR